MSLDQLKDLGSWLTPSAAYAALAVVGLWTIWQWMQNKKKKTLSEGDVDMTVIEELRGELRRIYDKIDELQRTVLENYATKEEVEVLRIELRDSRDKVIRLETEMESVQRQLAVIPKREGDRA